MLVLTRKRHQVIWIGDDVRIQVSDIRGDSVRIGIDAPDHVSIVREEVMDEQGGDADGKPQVEETADG